MTYYDRIQLSIDYMEDNLDSNIDINIAAKKAFMSISTFYRLFFALTGFTAKQYLRQRRIALALECLKKDEQSILEVAVRFGFQSHSTFSKATKKITGLPPSSFKKGSSNYTFERINIMDKYIDVKEFIDQEKYPGVKVLKELPKITVASYCYHGENPERNAFSVMNKWFKDSGLSIEKDKVRVFGFDNPSPQKGQKEYGYEVWVTIEKNHDIKSDIIKKKTFPGGKYAVCGVQDLDVEIGGDNIPKTWQKLRAWVIDSSFNFGEHQWLEEHTGFKEDLTTFDGMDLYMPIKKK